MKPPLVELLLIATLCGAPTPVDAADNAGPAPGAKVRVRHDDVRGALVGTLQGLTGDALEITTGGRTRALATAGLRSVETSAGERGRAGKGALIGAGAFLVLTAVLIADGGFAESGLASARFPAGLALAAGLGAAVGAGVRREAWRPATLPAGGSVRVTLTW